MTSSEKRCHLCRLYFSAKLAMPEFRWNPLLDTWTLVATNRQNRPHLPKDHCPFCPDSGNLPAHYEVLAYPNDFPVMSLDIENPKGQQIEQGIFKRSDAL